MVVNEVEQNINWNALTVYVCGQLWELAKALQKDDIKCQVDIQLCESKCSCFCFYSMLSFKTLHPELDNIKVCCFVLRDFHPKLCKFELTIYMTDHGSHPVGFSATYVVFSG